MLPEGGAAGRPEPSAPLLRPNDAFASSTAMLDALALAAGAASSGAQAAAGAATTPPRPALRESGCTLDTAQPVAAMGKARVLCCREVERLLLLVSSGANVLPHRPLNHTEEWCLFAEPIHHTRPITPKQLNDQYRNSGGASGSTVMPATLRDERGSMRAGIVRRYGVVRRRLQAKNLRYHEYHFADRRPGDFKLFHTLPSRPKRKKRRTASVTTRGQRMP